MALQLTDGSISLISSNNWQPTDVKPVVQVWDIGHVKRQTTGIERYHVTLSDGSFHVRGMLTTHLNELVHSDQLQKGSVVRLDQFVTNMLCDRLIIIILSLDVILSSCDIIGDPKPYIGEPSRRSSQAPIVPSRVPANSYMRPVQPIYNQPPPMYMNRVPTSINEATHEIIPIAGLNQYQGRWKIKARVTAKSELRHYNNARGDYCKVFSFHLLDSYGGEIRTTCYNDVADQFFYQIKVGKVYLISNGSIKPTQKAFDHLFNDHEITLDHTSTIQSCLDDGSIQQGRSHFCPVAEIEDLENNTILDSPFSERHFG